MHMVRGGAIWSYKPLQGTLSDEELAILDEAERPGRAGEIALERLQNAGNERIRNKKCRVRFPVRAGILPV